MSQAVIKKTSDYFKSKGVILPSIKELHLKHFIFTYVFKATEHVADKVLAAEDNAAQNVAAKAFAKRKESFANKPDKFQQIRDVRLRPNLQSKQEKND